MVDGELSGKHLFVEIKSKHSYFKIIQAFKIILHKTLDLLSFSLFVIFQYSDPWL